MAGYVTPKLPHPTGMRREDFEKLREQQGLDEKGFPIKRPANAGNAEEEDDILQN